MNKTIITILIMFSCNVTWGEAKWEKPLTDGELCCLYEKCNSEAVNRGYNGRALCQLHMDSLMLNTFYSPEIAAMYDEAVGFLETPNTPKEITATNGHRHEWYDKAYELPNSFQGKVIGRLCKIEGCKAEYDWTPKSRITIGKLQKEIEQLKEQVTNLRELVIIIYEDLY